MIIGAENILYIKIDDTFIPFACLTNNSFTEDVEMLETTTRANNGWKTSRPNAQSFSVSFEGLQINTTQSGGQTTKASYDRLKAIKRSRELQTFRIITSEGLFVEDFQGHITSIGEAAPVDDFLSFSGEILGWSEPTSSSLSGEYTLDSTLTTIDSTLITIDSN